MRINTKTGKIELLKRERQTLTEAVALLLQISKHGDNSVVDTANDCAECIGEIQERLDGKELVAPPY
jgi:hypothetical protein